MFPSFITSFFHEAGVHPVWYVAAAVILLLFVYFTKLISKAIKIIIMMILLGAIIFAGWGILFTQGTTRWPGSTDIKRDSGEIQDELDQQRIEFLETFRNR